jgi:hypothetical protein
VEHVIQMTEAKAFLPLPALSAALFLLACVPAVGQKQPLPQGFVAGGAYGLTASDCAALGGTSTRDGNGLDFCSLGPAEAVYACKDGGFVSVVRLKDGGHALIVPGGAVHRVSEQPAASGVLLTGDAVSLHAKGDAAILTQAGTDRNCTLAS